MGYPIHPLAAEYPVMAGEQRTHFFEHIAEHGQQEAVVLFDGQVLDGRHRQEAMEASGQEPRYRQFGSDPEDGDNPVAFVYRKNSQRRDLGYTDRQRLKRVNDKRIVQLRESGKSTRQIAKEVGVSQKSVMNILTPAKSVEYQYSPEAASPAPTQETPMADELAALDQSTVPEPTNASAPEPPPTPESPKRVKGRDGKSYPPTKPKKAVDPVAAWRKRLTVVLEEAPVGVDVLTEVKAILES